MATTKQDLFGWEQNRSEEGSRLNLLYYSKWGGFDVNVIETKKKWKWHQWECKRKERKKRKKKKKSIGDGNRICTKIYYKRIGIKKLNYIYFKYLLNKKHIYIYIYTHTFGALQIKGNFCHPCLRWHRTSEVGPKSKGSKLGQFNLIRANQFLAFLLGSFSVIEPFIVWSFFSLGLNMLEFSYQSHWVYKIYFQKKQF